MTAPLRATSTQTCVAPVALVSITVTRATIFYSDARCPNCHRLVMAIPGTPLFEVRAVASNEHRSGRGRVVSCHRCRTRCAIVEHAR